MTAGSNDTRTAARSDAEITAPRGTVDFATSTSTDDVDAVHNHTAPNAP